MLRYTVFKLSFTVIAVAMLVMLVRRYDPTIWKAVVPMSRRAGLKIPKLLIQTFETSNLPDLVQANSRRLSHHATDYEYRLYDAQMRENYIEENYPSALSAYRCLRAGANKGDLFKYVILYVEGGICFDLSVQPCDGVTIENIVGDRTSSRFVSDLNPGDLITALIACVPREPIMKKAIDMVIENVENYAMPGLLDVTGPALLGKAMKEVDRDMQPDFEYRRIGSGESAQYYIYSGETRLYNIYYPGYNDARIEMMNALGDEAVDYRFAYADGPTGVYECYEPKPEEEESD